MRAALLMLRRHPLSVELEEEEEEVEEEEEEEAEAADCAFQCLLEPKTEEEEKHKALAAIPFASSMGRSDAMKRPEHREQKRTKQGCKRTYSPQT